MEDNLPFQSCASLCIRSAVMTISFTITLRVRCCTFLAALAQPNSMNRYCVIRLYPVAQNTVQFHSQTATAVLSRKVTICISQNDRRFITHQKLYNARTAWGFLSTNTMNSKLKPIELITRKLISKVGRLINFASFNFSSEYIFFRGPIQTTVQPPGPRARLTWFPIIISIRIWN